MVFDNNSGLLRKLNIKHFDLLISTNTCLKELAQNGAPSGTVIIANSQSDGRGRMGRSFLSPEGGLYMSILLRPSMDIGGIEAAKSVHITALAAVAVSDAIEEVTGKKTGIKWVNDLFYEGKKVCGILAEGVLDGSGGFEYVVLGIGINLVGNFDNTELCDIATALYPTFDENALSKLKNRLIEEILRIFIPRYERELSNGEFFDDYKNGLFMLGKEVVVLQGENARNATVSDLNPDFTLTVRFDDGSVAALNSGEVRLRVRNEEG